jgi:hypothetical protein
MVVALDLAELLTDMLSVMIGHFDVAALDEYVHALTSPGRTAGDRWVVSAWRPMFSGSAPLGRPPSWLQADEV